MLDGFFHPRSVVLIGASAKSGAIGNLLARNLTASGRTQVAFVHPTASEILGLPCYPEISALPWVPDLAVIAVPAARVADTLTACARLGIGSALVIAAGFAETGAGGARLQAEITSLCRRQGIRAVGPNISGLLNCHSGLNASFATPGPERPGNISFMTQSGSAVMTLFEHGLDHHLRFAKVIDYGNQADVSDCEILEYLGGDPETHVIAAFLEGLSDARHFVEVARGVAKRKPIILGTVGRTRAGARAARAHTGSRIPPDAHFHRACSRAGVFVASGMPELADLVRTIHGQPLPAGRRVAVISASGGVAVELTDACAQRGLVLPALPAADQKEIRSLLPAFASARNPIDMGPVYARFPEIYSRCLELAFANAGIDIIMLTIIDRGASHVDALAAIRDTIVREQKARGGAKPVYVCWSSTAEARRNQGVLEAAGIPCFDHAERTARVAAALARK